VVGGAGADTITALSIKADGTNASTVTSFDSIDGGAGVDTLNIYTTVTTAVADNPATAGVDETVVGVALNASLPATASVKNVEIVNILNTNEAAAFGDASKFVGVTQLWQNTAAVNVTNLAATTTAGFKKTAGATVSAADAAASVTIALDTVNEGNTFVVNSMTGDGVLNAVNVSGTVKDVNTDGATNTNVNVTVGKDVQTLTVNAGVTTTLGVTNGAGTKVVNTVDLSASSAGVKYTGAANTVATIKGGAGKDELTNIFAGTATANAATLSGGAGDDKLTVNVTQGAATAVTASVDGGEGKDTINLTVNTGVTYTVTGGAGDDTVAVTGTVKTTDSIDGGDGTDTVSLAGSLTARTADDFIVFNKVLKGFETIKFTSAEGDAGTSVAFDASKLAANFTSINLFAASVIDNVGSQALIANGNLNAESVGYIKVGEGSPAATAIVNGGTLAITSVAAGTVKAYGEIANLTVTPVSDKAGDVDNTAVTLLGDVKTANVTLSVTTDTANTTATADDVFETSSLVFTNAVDNAKLATLTISGNGAAGVTNANNTALVTVDASGLNTVNIAGTALNGLTYSSTNTKAETIKLSAGIDSVTLGASTYGKVDTVEGLKLVMNAAKTALTAASDTLAVTGFGDLVAAGKFTTTQTDLDLALKDAAASATNIIAFQLGGDTYLLKDAGTDGQIDAADTVVKLAGLIDLDALVLALN
jgi:trimeric autotransporter adhesin